MGQNLGFIAEALNWAGGKEGGGGAQRRGGSCDAAVRLRN
jgi:hypothetical protein